MADTMDYKFPPQLFPAFYNCGPPDTVLKAYPATWGCYDQVRPQVGSGPVSSSTFTSRHQVKGEIWRHTEPVPIPLLSPKNAYLWSSKPPDPLDFTEHMQNFFMDHYQDAFGCMSEILGENFNFTEQKKRHCKDSVHMRKMTKILDMLDHKICHQSYSTKSLESYSVLLSDAVHSVPPELLGALLHEELTEQRDRLLFSEGATGGALAFIPFAQRDLTSQSGCLLYPGNQGLDRLNFHTLELQHQTGSPSCVDVGRPFSFQLKGPVRQISATSLFNECCVGVRSDHLCGVWRFSESNEPRLLQVVNTREVATCISVSPHVLGEVLVASESGAANLWTIGKGMQKVRKEDSNLYFNANSSWRWCEFSAHPRVVLYADRTGVELSDLRTTPASNRTLFRISKTTECRSGERLILSRYLGDVHSFHHLITTQYSAYIMDERFPCMPMLKWDHLMRSPPMFCHVLPGSVSCGSAVGGSTSAKILLGSQSSQEITLLQYAGGRAEACSSRGPPQSLLRPRDSLKELPVQIPHRLDTATNRLSAPAAGLTCIQKRGGSGEECICILQLTEAGDIFYQVLEQEASKLPQPSSFAHGASSGRKTSEQSRWTLSDSQPVVSDTSSDEGLIRPTQPLTVQRFVPETPERKQIHSDTSSEDSETERRRRRPKSSLQVVVNDDPEPGGADEADRSSSSPSGFHPPEQQAPVKLGNSALITWKRWLQKVMNKSREKKTRPRHLPHFAVLNTDLLHPPGDEERDQAEEDLVQSLRRDLRACMSNRSLLVCGVTATGLEDAVPLPNPVEAEDCTDHLSQRLTVSWQGEEAWRAWWVEHLGLNREEKVSALKRKRQREKAAKRAAGRGLELSASFTSSVSYQSELGDFSDSTGWSSAASQDPWSDTEKTERGGPLSRLEASLVHRPPADTPVPTPTTTPLKMRDKQGDQHTLSGSHSLKPESTLARQRRSKRLVEDYLSSLFAQDDSSQHDGYFPEEGSAPRPAPPSFSAPPPAASSFSSSQLLSSQSAPQRAPRVGLSQDTWLSFSQSHQSQSLPQSSQGRPGLSQASQTKKKKSRMGF